jgi:hypothetical protein
MGESGGYGGRPRSKENALTYFQINHGLESSVA